MANNNGLNVLDAITAAKFGKGAGGGTGSVTKEYVDTQVGAVSERVDDVESVIPSAATPQNPLATTGDVNGEEITVTSTTSPLTDSADGMVQGLTIYGQSEVVEGEIVSAGEGYAVVDLGTLDWEYISDSAHSRFEANYLGIKRPASLEDKANILCAKYDTRSSNDIYNHIYNKSIAYHPTLYKIWVYDTTYTDAATFKSAMSGVMLTYQLADPTQGNAIAIKTDDGSGVNGTMATFTTALPLRSTLDGTTRDELIIGNGKAEVITRCEVVDDNIVPLATPVTTPLTDAEISAFRGLKTYDGTTNITISDEPDFEIDYLKNTENGQAVSNIQKDLQGQIDGITVELTQAEYDALTEEEKNNGTIYFITDAPSGITIDSQLSVISTNAVQNRVITSQVNKILSEAEIQAQINDRIYQGTDLTVKFADEISASPYNGDPWAWIKARIQANNFAGIHVCDYIPITTTNSVTLNAQIAGINTYKNYGDSPVGAHIDFICKELWPTPHPINPVNFNNGTATQNYPWLASDLYLYLNSLAGTAPSAAEVGGGTGTAVDYTADGVYYYLPTQLKAVIIEKRFLLPKRYSASGLLSDDNSCGWVNIGKLWLPDECEVYGMPVWGGKGGYSLGGSALQYPLFAGNMNRLKFRNGSRSNWWLLSPYSGNSTRWCSVGADGICDHYNASASWIAAPVCFRVG